RETDNAPVAPAAVYKTIAVPNPARRAFKILPAGGVFTAPWPAPLRIYDSNMNQVETIDDYRGGEVEVSGYANGLYFYRLCGPEGFSEGKITVRR
ncbi:MAG TPA: T9SS type A sorting domain-containing protein, partial [Candidatus Wallbacteria bacterium]|nr:T9SS type A sorting domain-containing protein [Candidatus Wallbacteria bacterium]